ncbi:helix-turn-helix domain-containing protein [Umezawaea sp. Da 62-37]|uniref:winged helix-turn-helix transcriptional regulator n=1 Tax=Umezawaea sp. Da 62-37 TaxID=3075927 RepID=UPI0028F72398|nr:helix-turn-helix domain-containing protein [Umezawaea sp. Da 62-37]WNV84657.1 helix-turn-helix domain-containing protein [Umezawaea sp. Da 62-37]
MDTTTTPRRCSIAGSLHVLGERWTLLAVREMSYGVHRFEQIAGHTGASRNILTDRLRTLEEAGVVERRRYSERPPRFEYHLTGAGAELAPVLLALSEWGDKWANDPPITSFDHDCGLPLKVDHTCHHCHREITPGSVTLR